MKFVSLTLTAVLAVSAIAVTAPAWAAKSCDELKSEISTKLDGKKVTGYTLEVIAADQVGGKKVVGSCEGGSKKIVYSKK